MSKKLKVFGIHLENSAVAYYRLWLPFAELNKQKLCECSRYPDEMGKGRVSITASDKTRFSDDLPSMEEIGQDNDLVVWQRIEKMDLLAIALALRANYAQPFVAECDDDLTNPQPHSRAYGAYRPRRQDDDIEVIPITTDMVPVFKTRKDGFVRYTGEQWVFVTLKDGGNYRENIIELFKRADGLTTTTPYLAKLFQQFNPYSYVLPNCLDVPRWKKAAQKRKHSKDKVVIGWLGGMQHYEDLLMLKDVIPEILDRCPNAVFLTTMALPDFWKDLKLARPEQFVTVPFAPIQTWPEHLGSLGIDIGLAPLTTAVFNDSKSNLKFLEYSALGIPGVYSPRKAYDDVKHGETGMLANSTREWIELVISLVNDASLRERMGKAARTYAFDQYDIAKKAILWKNAYEEIYDRGYKLARREQDQAREVIHRHEYKGNTR